MATLTSSLLLVKSTSGRVVTTALNSFKDGLFVKSRTKLAVGQVKKPPPPKRTFWRFDPAL